MGSWPVIVVTQFMKSASHNSLIFKVTHFTRLTHSTPLYPTFPICRYETKVSILALAKLFLHTIETNDSRIHAIQVHIRGLHVHWHYCSGGDSHVYACLLVLTSSIHLWKWSESEFSHFLSATEFTIPWRTIIRHGGCCLSVCRCVCVCVPGQTLLLGNFWTLWARGLKFFVVA